MTRTAISKLEITLQSNLSHTMDDLPARKATGQVGGQVIKQDWRTGAEANQANQPWEREWTISSGATEDLDVYDLGSVDIGAGAGNDMLGQSFQCEELVAIMVIVTGGTGSLEINPTNPTNKLTWSPTLTVANNGALQTNGLFLISNPGVEGLDVTDASSHVIRFGANGGDVTLRVILIGRTDDEVSSSSGSSSSSSSSTSTNSSSVSSSSSSSTSTLSSSSTSTVSSLSSSTASSLSSSST